MTLGCKNQQYMKAKMNRDSQCKKTKSPKDEQHMENEKKSVQIHVYIFSNTARLRLSCKLRSCCFCTVYKHVCR